MAFKSNKLPAHIRERMGKFVLERKPIPKPSKFGNVKEEGWDSQAERRRWKQLLLIQKAGEISHLQRQVTVQLHVGRRSMRVDFMYYDKYLDEMVWEDHKGFATPSWLIKADIWCAGFGPGLLRVHRSGGRTEDRRPKVHAETLRRILRSAHETMSAEEFGRILAGKCDSSASSQE